MALLHKYALVCDDVRREDNGKIMILGLYTPGIVLPHFPVQLPKLIFFNFFDVTAPGSWELVFRLSHVGTGAMVGPEGKFRLDAHQAGHAVAQLVVANANFQMPGDYSFTLTGADFEGAMVTFPVAQRVAQRLH